VIAIVAGRDKKKAARWRGRPCWFEIKQV